MVESIVHYATRSLAALVVWYGIAKLYYVLTGGVGHVVLRHFPDGRSFYVIQGDFGTSLIHKEIFQNQCYLRHGVSLPTGPITADKREASTLPPLIIDVGGNLGMFSAYVAEHVPNAEIHTFEPAPLLIQAAKQNLAKFGSVRVVEGWNAVDSGTRTSATTADGTRQLTLYQVALGDASGEIEFSFDPRASAGSTMLPDTFVPAPSQFIQFVRAIYLDGIPAGIVPEFPTRFLCSLLAIPVLNIFFLIMLLPLIVLHVLFVKAGAAEKINVRTVIVRLSDVLEKKGLAGRPIEMMKIDVEGAEWKVLQGITDDTWENIQQIVVEIHDSGENRIEKVKALLLSKGFMNIHEEREDLELHKLIKLSTVFATKKAKK